MHYIALMSLVKGCAQFLIRKLLIDANDEEPKFEQMLVNRVSDFCASPNFTYVDR